MGLTFRYIDDAILPLYLIKGEECQACDRPRDLYRFYEDLPTPDGSPSPVDAVCAECLQSGSFQFGLRGTLIGRVTQFVNRHFTRGTLSGEARRQRIETILGDYLRTPHLPNIAWDDWPDCCGDFTEFVGDAGSTYRGSFDGFEFRGPEDDVCIRYGIEGNMRGEDRVSLFRCLACGKKCWTLRYT